MENVMDNYVEFVISTKDHRIQLFRNYIKENKLNVIISDDNHLGIFSKVDEITTVIVLANDTTQEVMFGVEFDKDNKILDVVKKFNNKEKEQSIITDMKTGKILHEEPISDENNVEPQTTIHDEITTKASCPPGYVLREYNCKKVAKTNWPCVAACLIVFKRPVCITRCTYTVKQCSVDCFPTGVIG